MIYRPFTLRDESMTSLSPVRLFLFLFQPILDLLLYHTNLTATRDRNRRKRWVTITVVEMRYWLIVKLRMAMNLATTTSMALFWSNPQDPPLPLSQHRFFAIKRYLSVNSSSQPPTDHPPWFWRVSNALEVFRRRLQEFLLPGSHLAVDESSIKFHGRSRHIFRLDHKPDKSGFIVYIIASHGGAIHDFLVSSPKEGIESIPRDGITVDLATRTTRARKQGTTGATVTEVHLSMTKSVVYTLVHRLTHLSHRSQGLAFLCFTDNLFTDSHLVRALLSLNVAVCGTMRRNAPGLDPLLRAITSPESRILADDSITYRIYDDKVLTVVWRDPERQHSVLFCTTAFSPYHRELAPRKSRFTTS